MYQWQEHKETKETKKLGGGTQKETTWTYEKKWSDERIDSDQFKEKEGHINPASMRFPRREVTAQVVQLGAFRLSPGLLGQLNQFEPLPMDAALVKQLPEELKKQSKLDGSWLYLPKDAKEKVAPGKPQIGDLRVKFEVVQPTTVSLIARQVGETFEPWQSDAGTQIESLVVGESSAENMIGQMERENTTWTWVLRGIGFLVMAVGIGMVFRPLVVVADVVPFLGNLLGAGVGVFAALIAGGLSLVTIAIAWLAYRPLLGISLLVVAGVLFFLLFSLRKRRPAVSA
jgi:hypothetical protein